MKRKISLQQEDNGLPIIILHSAINLRIETVKDYGA